MARRNRALAGNAPGALFVDDTCIDCGTCYTLVPEIFRDADGHSLVATQPIDPESQVRAGLAQVACPTASIGGTPTSGLRAASHAFPLPWTDGVHFCGWTSSDSFGAWSWFIERRHGNVLVDSPKAAKPLIDRLKGLGGIRWHLLTHIDDVADHEALHQTFETERVMHVTEGLPVERPLDLNGPLALADDLLVLPTPGHTRGSICLLFDRRVLFTGDTLWWNPDLGLLSASKAYCWHDWSTQLRSLESLLDHDFTWVLPGHGAPHRARDPGSMRSDLERCLARLRSL